MALLQNRVNRKELKKKIQETDEARITVSFYKYFQIENPDFFRNNLFKEWQKIGVFGRIYVAQEGINAQISVPEINWENFKAQLYSIPELNGCRLNTAIEDNGKSFFTLTIKVRKKIVADGIDDPDFDSSKCGVHLKAKEFNEIIQKSDVVLIDMRNHYESEVGHFENALTPEVETFRESLPIIVDDLIKGQEDKEIVMYCTGGIRCEKASAYLKHKGFDKVYQLEGGIIEYSRQCQLEGIENRFKGKNFVFDERLGERISPDILANCHQCGASCDDHTNCANVACNLLFIQCPECKAKYNGCCSDECKGIIALPEEEQEKIRKANYAAKRYSKRGLKK